ncbi:MAG: nucleotidyltransferase family protein [Ferruginibacter sp.]
MRECIILAGGMGTRLQSVVADLPKCMAPINGRPFLLYIFEWLKKHDFDRIILSLGYKSESIIDFLNDHTWPFEIVPVIEKEPLGTGGAMALALQQCKGLQVFIMNGDTFFDIDPDEFLEYHLQSNAELTIAAKPLTDYNRYGSLLCNSEGRITGFTEKRQTTEGIINGGIYLLDVNSSVLSGREGRFSFETDIMEKEYPVRQFFAYPDNGYFIDIGIPEDYRKAEIDFKKLFG